MIDDPVAMAGMVAREVRTGEREGVTTRVVVARRTFATDPDDLWSCLTDPERLPRWFLPVSGDLEVGGRYQTEGNAGGVIERCEAPTLLAVTWEMGEQGSWLELRLAPDGDGTRLELVHEAPVAPEFWNQFGPGAVGVGWDLAIMALGLHVDSGEAVDPSTAMTFPMSDAGRSYISTAATSWGEAAAADGDDPAAAREAAERTFAFYTTMPEGEPEPDA